VRSGPAGNVKGSFGMDVVFIPTGVVAAQSVLDDAEAQRIHCVHVAMREDKKTLPAEGAANG
jgi:hypothetical protein